MSRTVDLNRMKTVLNSPEGEALMQELADMWDANTLLGDSPERTAYNVGLRDAFKFMDMLRNGDFINE